MFDALVKKSIKEQKSKDGGPKYVEFVEVGDGLLPTVLLCMADGGTEHGISVMERHVRAAIQSLSDSRWSDTSPLKKRENDIKALFNVQRGQLADKLQSELSKLISKYYAYQNGVIAVSF